VESVVAAVEPVTSSAVDLLTDVPLTPTASYRLEVEGVADVLGTVIDAADGIAVFTGFEPPRPASRVFELYRFLPELNRREDEPATFSGSSHASRRSPISSWSTSIGSPTSWIRISHPIRSSISCSASSAARSRSTSRRPTGDGC
jgi:hypothetical protein